VLGLFQAIRTCRTARKRGVNQPGARDRPRQRDSKPCHAPAPGGTAWSRRSCRIGRSLVLAAAKPALPPLWHCCLATEAGFMWANRWWLVAQMSLRRGADGAGQNPHAAYRTSRSTSDRFG